MCIRDRLCTAYASNAPVLCVTSEIFSQEIGKGHGILHELPDQLAILKGLTKWSARINHATEAPHLVEMCIRDRRKRCRARRRYLNCRGSNPRPRKRGEPMTGDFTAVSYFDTVRLKYDTVRRGRPEPPSQAVR